MARSDNYQPSTAIPEADRLEQQQPADPQVEDDQAWPTSPMGEVDDADRLEQAQVVVGDPDEEYTPDPP